VGKGRASFIEPDVGRVSDDVRPSTLSKEPMLANWRLAFNRTRDRDVVSKLLKELGPRYKARPGGYTRTMKMGFGICDNAPMAFVELVDRPEPATDEAKAEAAAKFWAWARACPARDAVVTGSVEAYQSHRANGNQTRKGNARVAPSS
jgi:hypothetical protein